MAKKVKKAKKSPSRSTASSVRSSSRKELSPVMQVGVVFVIVAAMLLLWYVGKMG